MLRVSKNAPRGITGRRGGLVVSGRTPFANAAALTKAIGDSVTATWQISNTGDTVGVARLLIMEGATVLATGANTNVAAQANNVPVPVTWTVPAGYTVGTHNLIVRAQNVTGTPVTLADNAFTVTRPASGPILSASGAAGQPTIV
jgi:hypothetical protein